MLTGQKGVKYGLTVPKKESKPLIKKNVFAFGDDDSDDERKAVANRVNKQAQQKQADKKVEAMQAAALAEDPSIFDYDAHYEDTQQQRAQARPIGAPVRESKYIQGLLDKTKERNREQDIVYERRLLKERQVEDHLFGDKESFVTTAYKKKLEEDKKWQEEEKMRDKVEAEQDVRKRGHMGDFYRNLLTRNVAMGATAPSKAPSQDHNSKSVVPKDSSATQNAVLPDSSQTQSNTRETSASGIRESGAKAAKGEEWERMRRAREAYEAKQTIKPLSTDREANGNLLQGQEFDKRIAESAAKDQSNNEAINKTVQEPVLTAEEKAASARERYLARKRKTLGT